MSAGNGLSTTAQSIALGGTATLSVNVDDSTIEISEMDNLQLKDSGITNTKIANGTIDLTTKVNGILPIANGGTGANTLNNLITLGTHTTGNYVATIADWK